MENRSEIMLALARETAEALPSFAVERNLVAAFRANQMRRGMPYAAIAASILLLLTSAWLVRSPQPVLEPAEVATEFIAVPGADLAGPIDEPILVRVSLPRTAMVNFGLPMNAERGTEFVKADVVLGHDGVARAIRFVQ